MIRSADRQLRTVVYRIVGEDDLDDVMQIAYLKAFRSWPDFRSTAESTTWLYRIAINAALDHLRTRRRVASVMSRVRPDSGVGDVAVTAADAVDLARVVDSLPVDQRLVLLLVDGRGLSHGEAAEALGVAVGTVGSRLSRARGAARQMLEGGSHDE